MILQIAAVLCFVTVAVLAVPLPGIEETFGHYPLDLSHAPAIELPSAPVAIAHAPLAVAHTPIIKEVEHVVSPALTTFQHCLHTYIKIL